MHYSKKSIQKHVGIIIKECIDNITEYGGLLRANELTGDGINLCLRFKNNGDVNGIHLYTLFFWGGEIQMTESAYKYFWRSAELNGVPVIMVD